jgi:2-polyprenyl-3-methyl-5-hydroxy-6-metoxy-1,4-benzoquinol methylase
MKNDLDQFVKAYEGDIQYDFDNRILLNWYPKRILNFVEPNNSLLELGLGHGYSTNLFANYFRSHIVLDGSKAVIENFTQKHPKCNAKIIETYFEEFDTDERFDVIVMGFILEHVDDPVQIMSMYKKFLKPDGKMFVAVPNAEVLNRRLGHIAGMLADIQQMSSNDHVLGHQRYYTKEQLTADVKESGFRVDKMEGIYLKPLMTSQMISLNLDPKLIDALCEVGISYPELSCGLLAEIVEIK